MVNRKGFEIHFHWIFVLIAGAVILFFFFSVVQKQRVFSEQKLSIALSRDIEAVFSSAVESKGTSQLLTVPKGGIAFSCSGICDCNFWIGRKATQFGDNIIFAPDFLESGSAVAWSLDWKMPFRAANFLFLKGLFDKYFVVVDSYGMALVRLLNKSLPSDVALSVVSSSEVGGIVPVEGVRYRFVFLDIPASPPFGLSDAFRKNDVSVVFVDSADKSVTFYEKERHGSSFSADTSLYLGDPALFAAFFSADKAMFECGLKRAFARLSIVASVSRERSIVLESDMSAVNRSDCVYFAPGIDYLQDIVSNARVLSLSSSFVDNADKFAGLAVAVDGIDSLNRNLVQQSCPGIY